MELHSTAFVDGEFLPARHAARHGNQSPPLNWTTPPHGTQELAIICDDPDAHSSNPWIHWIISGISPEVLGLPAGIPPIPEQQTPFRFYQGRNSWREGQTLGYRGPQPPPGDPPHRYRFRLFASDRPLGLPPGIDAQTLAAQLDGHILSTATLTALFAP
jgi:Raf kinase inhibitor-like YbhB/YbcL family protein